MDFDDIHRASEKQIWKPLGTVNMGNAIVAASRFSNGRTCIRGRGSGGEARSFPVEPRREGSFNFCFWIKVDGMDTEQEKRARRGYRVVLSLSLAVCKGY